ncbi:hypothetical protein CRUP_034508 [Coryphaenoides rupestris]|nr:hypothetical protein CRUP_034508 [Coryphaenoides rupestris]
MMSCSLFSELGRAEQRRDSGLGLSWKEKGVGERKGLEDTTLEAPWRKGLQGLQIDQKVSLEGLEKLKLAFEEYEPDGRRSLDERSFGLLVNKCLGLHNTEEFCTYMQLEYSKREECARRRKQAAFSLPAKVKHLTHGEPVLRIRAVSDATVVTLREGGAVQYWSPGLHLQKTKTNQERAAYRKPKDRELRLYELSSLEAYCQISGLETLPLMVDYCYTGPDECAILYGDCQVKYFPEFSAIVSSSNDEASSVVIGCVRPSTNVEQKLREITEDGKAKKAPFAWTPQPRAPCDQTVFGVYKGVKTFDLCKRRNVLVTGGVDRLIWDIQDHRCLFTAQPKASMIHGDLLACLYSPAMKALFIAADHLSLLSLKTRRRIPGHVIASHGEPVLCCGYSEQLRQVVSCSEGSDRPEDPGQIQSPQPAWPDDLRNGHREDILCMAQCPPALLATGSYDGEILVWNAVSGHVQARLPPARSRSRSRSRSRPGPGPRRAGPPPPRHRHHHRDAQDSSILSLIFLRSGGCDTEPPRVKGLLSAGTTGYVNFWNVQNGGKLVCGFKAITKLSTAGDGADLLLQVVENGQALLTSSTDCTVRLWSVRGEFIGGCVGLQVVENGQALLTSSTDCTVRLWSVRGEFIGLWGLKLPPESMWWRTIISIKPVHFQKQHPAVPHEILVDPLSMPAHHHHHHHHHHEDAGTTDATVDTDPADSAHGALLKCFDIAQLPERPRRSQDRHPGRFKAAATASTASTSTTTTTTSTSSTTTTTPEDLEPNQDP